MFISPAQRRKRITITVIFGLLLLPSLVVGFMLYRDRVLEAGADEVPQEVTISDVTDRSAVISWVTPDAPKEGWVQWGGESGFTTGSPLALDERDISSGETQKRTTHYVKLSELQPDSNYFFVIGSGANSYEDESGDDFSFRTAPLSVRQPDPDLLLGTVITEEESTAIIYLTLENDSGEKSSSLSALSGEKGAFEIDLSAALTEDLSSEYHYDDETKMQFFIQGAEVGTGYVELLMSDRDDIELVLSADEQEVFDEESDETDEDVDGPAEPTTEDEEEDDEEVEMEDDEDSLVDDTDNDDSNVDECEPACDGRACGADGCGGSCGTCPSGEACSLTGLCISGENEEDDEEEEDGDEEVEGGEPSSIVFSPIVGNTSVPVESDEVDRGIYSETGSDTENLPYTAVNMNTRAVIALVIAFVFMAGSSFFFLGTYRGMKNERWERDAIRSIESDDAPQ